MDEHYVESIYEKTKIYQPWLQIIDEGLESNDEEEIKENWV